ncbi:MAG: fibronectin type III domain-containing protein [Caulobacteraceae bacterium]
MKSSKFIVRCGIALLIIFSMLCQTSMAATAHDTQAPTAPEELIATNRTYTTISLSWTSSYDNTKVKGYQVYRDGKKIVSTTKTTYTNKDLVPGRKYAYAIRAYDAAGNISESSLISSGTVPDKTAPSAPSGLKPSSITVTEVNLTWQPASDNVNVKGYDIIRDGIKIGTTSKTSYCNKGLIPGKSYTYTVRAYDVSGNLSKNSPSLSVATLNDTQAPTAPSGLKVTAVKGSSVSLTWTASADNAKVAGYQIYCNGIVICK